jgi:hypothetical protein
MILTVWDSTRKKIWLGGEVLYLSKQASSGKSVAAFCGERGLRDWQLYEWKKRFASDRSNILCCRRGVSSDSTCAASGSICAGGRDRATASPWLEPDG